MSSKSTTVNVQWPVGFILFVVFLVLKLTHVIAWSWWWVTAPLWIPAGIGLVAVLVGGIIVTVAKRLESPQDRKAREAREALLEYRRGQRRR